MRPSWFGPALALLLAGCDSSPPSTPPSASSTTATVRAAGINPANIRRVGRDLPQGYEVSNVARAASPRAIWGLGDDATANPPECLGLADPDAGRGRPAQGVSGSGSGGIVDAVVVSASVTPSRELVSACAHWELTTGRTVESVDMIDAPHIDGAQTLGLVANIRAAVESGNQIDSRAYTFVAYLGDYYAFTTLTIDPGSMLPPLSPHFAAELLIKTVSTLRG
ncbi:DUF5642 family protein [Mycobacterium sp. ML4]